MTLMIGSPSCPWPLWARPCHSSLTSIIIPVVERNHRCVLTRLWQEGAAVFHTISSVRSLMAAALTQWRLTSSHYYNYFTLWFIPSWLFHFFFFCSSPISLSYRGSKVVMILSSDLVRCCENPLGPAIHQYPHSAHTFLYLSLWYHKNQLIWPAKC